MMSKIDHTDWDGLIELAKAELRPCKLCASLGRETRITPKGSTWLGMGYSSPQYFEILHFCERPNDDDFVDIYISMRVRDLDDLIRRWNK